MADTYKTPHIQIFTTEMAARFEEIKKEIKGRDKRFQELKADLHEPTTDVEKVQAIEAEHNTLMTEGLKIAPEVDRLMILQEIQANLDFARLYIKLGREITQVAPTEIADVLKIISNSCLEILRGVEFEGMKFDELQQPTTFVTTKYYHKFLILTNAGFSMAQAKQILLTVELINRVQIYWKNR